MNKLAAIILSIGLVFSPLANSGVKSKLAKTYMAAQIVKQATPAITKKIADKAARKAAQKKLAEGSIRKNELTVGKYEDLTAARPRAKKLGQQTEPLDAHHMPSTNYIKSKGVPKGEGVAMEMQPARNAQTRTYGNKDPALLNETPRQALGKDIRDARKVYQEGKVYSPEVRKSLQKVIKQNKQEYPNLYKK